MTDTQAEWVAQRLQSQIDALNAAPNAGALSRCWVEANDVTAALMLAGQLTPDDWADADRALRAAWQARHRALGE